MKFLTDRSFCLLLSTTLLVGIANALAIPTNNVVPAASGAPDVIRLNLVLRADRHLANPRRAAFYENWSDSPQDVGDAVRTFKEQKLAIAEVKSRHLLTLLPNLILFLDYPASGGVPSLPPRVESIYAEALDSWPAYNAVISFGKEAVSPLKDYIKNPSSSILSRLTALQVLWSIDKDQARSVAAALESNNGQSGQGEIVEIVKDILSDKKPFWGEIVYDPVVMSPDQVRSLLDTKLHFVNPLGVIDNYRLIEPGTHGSQLTQAKAKFDFYTKQKEAIRSAGKLKMVDLIPNLVLYMDYPVDRSVMFSDALSSLLQNRRREYPALDSILNMGSSSIKPLEGLIVDKKQDIQIRFTALSVLHDVDAKEALAYEKPFLDELKARKEDRYVEKTQYLFKLSAS